MSISALDFSKDVQYLRQILVPLNGKAAMLTRFDQFLAGRGITSRSSDNGQAYLKNLRSYAAMADIFKKMDI